MAVTEGGRFGRYEVPSAQGKILNPLESEEYPVSQYSRTATC